MRDNEVATQAHPCSLVSLDNERGLIGALLMFGDKAADVAKGKGITETTLAAPENVATYKAVMELIQERDTTDGLLQDLPLRLKSATATPPGGNWSDYLAAALNLAPGTLAGVSELCDLLKETESRRAAYQAGEELKRAAETAPLKQVKALADKAAGAVTQSGRAAARLMVVNLDRVPDGGGVKWLWQSHIELGAMTIINGMPGAGKSLFTIDLAARISTGRAFADGLPGGAPGRVLMFVEEGESIANTIKPRLRGAGADMRMIDVVDCVRTADGGESYFTLRNLEPLAAAVERMPDLRLIVIDPAGSYIGGDTDAGQDNKVREVLRPLLKLVERANVALVIVTHSRKNANGRADDLILGSRAFSGAPRCIWHIGKDQDEPERVLFLPGKISNAPRPAGLAYRITQTPDGFPRLLFEDSPVEMTADEAFCNPPGGAAKSGRPDERLQQAADWLNMALQGGARKVSELITSAADYGNISERTLHRAAAELRVIKTRAGRDYFWSLPGA